MTVIRFGGFRGEIPRIHPQLLPTENAQTALNVRLDSGALESIKDVQTEQATGLTDPISLYRYAPSIWLESVNNNDWVSFPVVSDAYGRLLYVDPTVNELRVTDASVIGTGPTPGAYTPLDVPAPTQGFSVTLNGTPDDEDEVPETRYYVCTYVNSYGAEGPPSPISGQVEWRTGQTVTIDNLPTLVGTYNITHRRIYRINTGASGTTNYQFVSEVAVTQAQKIIDTISKADPVVVKTTTAHGLTTGQEVIFSNLGASSTKPIQLIQKSNPVQITTTEAHGLSSGWTVAIEGLGSGNGMDELDGVRGVITIVDTTRFTIAGIDSTAYTDYVSGGTAARVFGADELNGNQYFVSVIDTDEFELNGVDGTAYKDYVEEGIVKQVAGTSYVDNVPSGNLGEVLPTEIYDPPNNATKGIKEHPAGFLVGFYGRTLTFSEPGAPHAWPIDYRKSTNHDIIGLGVFGNTVVVTTKGWPYLVIGSDPAAMTMVELEIEQACVGRRSIVDFGTVVAYASPDGLIVIDGGGATNATAALFTRDQWQALVPSSFVAFNWENKYLCFYDDGTVQRGFIVDPFAPEYGVRYVDKYATGGYRDIEEDLLYLIIGTNIEKWDQSSTKLQYTWKSKPIYTSRALNMSAAKVFADAYPVTVEFHVDGVRRYTRLVTSLHAFRLPGGFRGEKFELVIKGKRRVSEVIMATTMTELSATV